MLSKEGRKIRNAESYKRWSKSESGKNWLLKNREKRLQFTRNWREKDKGHYLQLQRNYNKENRMKIIEVLGGKCVKCGFLDWRALQVDHINGGGTKDIRSKGTNIYYRCLTEDIIKNPNKFQLLCANCNWIKRYENKETGSCFI